MRFLIAGLLVFLILAVLYSYYRNRKMYRTIDRMLDEVLNREPISVSDIKEGEISALAGKAVRIQEKLELELVRAEQEKEQVKGLISNMSHQIKTPLANVMMYQELLEGEAVSEEQKRVFLGKMRQQMEKIDWILRSLFKMVRLEQGAILFEAAPLTLRNTLLGAVNTVYEKADKKHIEIITEPFEDCTLYHNEKWTAEVFANILENAVKYTQEGGRIYIHIHPMELFTEIRIEDNGMGIREEELPDVFKRFYRSQDVEHKEGSGIGLYLSRLILEQEGGYMTVKSAHGKGSSFSVFLQNCQNQERDLS